MIVVGSGSALSIGKQGMPQTSARCTSIVKHLVGSRLCYFIRAALSLGTLGAALATSACTQRPPFWAPRSACESDPSAFTELQNEPLWGRLEKAGFYPTAPDSAAPIQIRVERVRCDFRAHVQMGGRLYTMGPFASIDEGSFRGDPDHHRFGFVVTGERGQQSAIIDGERGAAYRQVQAPQFSENGQHVAYLAQTERGAVLVSDGKEVENSLGKVERFLAVLNDGRAVYEEPVNAREKVLHAGTWASKPYSTLANFTVWRGERFAGLLMGNPTEAVINGVTFPVTDGVVSGFHFSADGAHALMVLKPSNLNDQFPRFDEGFAVLIDGVRLTPTRLRGVTQPAATYWGNVPVFLLYPDPRGSDAGLPPAVMVLGVSTPASAPTHDDYTQVHSGKLGTFVWIGESRGPRFDRIEPSSMYIDEEGRVRYRGYRGNEMYDVIDNQIIMREFVLKHGQFQTAVEPETPAVEKKAPAEE
ncbi:MAG: hypothetical protein IPK82_36590 [Polyangiaceae bacterium]|nr:hypothetical protein [Polyangiaceae bacterium]